MGKLIKNAVKDSDGNSYNGIQIENQFWLTENLSVSKYRNGDLIPQVEDNEEWSKLTTGAWCYYNNDIEHGEKFGKLYNWYAVVDPRGLAPEGYHIPSHDEWESLMASLGGDFCAGGKMKEKGTVNWASPNEKGNNQSGFTALPGGFRWKEDGFDGSGDKATFWTTSEHNEVYGKLRQIGNKNRNVILSYSPKEQGCSIRCIKDSEEIITGIKIGNLEVYKNDIGSFNYLEAKLACAKIGAGWRLPTKEELNQLYSNKDTIGQFTEGFYWSSTNADDVGVYGSAWGQRFSDGFQNGCSTTSKFKNFVRPVKSS